MKGRSLLLLVLPSIIYLLAMFVYPFGYGVFLSLPSAKGASAFPSPTTSHGRHCEQK